MATTTTDENKELIHEYLAAWNDEERETFPPILAEDFTATYTNPTGVVTQLDADQLRDLWTESFEERSHPQTDVHEMVAENDRVLTRITYSFLHDGDYLGIAPTGDRIEYQEYFSFRIENGEIAELHSLADNLNRLRQLDVEIPIDG